MVYDFSRMAVFATSQVRWRGLTYKVLTGSRRFSQVLAGSRRFSQTQWVLGVVFVTRVLLTFTSEITSLPMDNLARHSLRVQTASQGLPIGQLVHGLLGLVDPARLCGYQYCS